MLQISCKFGESARNSYWVILKQANRVLNMSLMRMKMEDNLAHMQYHAGAYQSTAIIMQVPRLCMKSILSYRGPYVIPTEIMPCYACYKLVKLCQQGWWEQPDGNNRSLKKQTDMSSHRDITRSSWWSLLGHDKIVIHSCDQAVAELWSNYVRDMMCLKTQHLSQSTLRQS